MYASVVEVQGEGIVPHFLSFLWNPKFKFGWVPEFLLQFFFKKFQIFPFG